MSFSDCPRCWDTPCTCGYFGYMTVYAPMRHKETLQKLSKEKLDELKARLANLLEHELDLQ